MELLARQVMFLALVSEPLDKLGLQGEPLYCDTAILTCVCMYIQIHVGVYIHVHVHISTV